MPEEIKNKAVAFVSKYANYVITLKPILQSITATGLVVVVDKGLDAVFHDRQFSTDNQEIIELMRKSSAIGIDFWEEATMPANVKAKLDITLSRTIVKSGVADTSYGPDSNLEEERKKLAADRKAFEKEKAAHREHLNDAEKNKQEDPPSTGRDGHVVSGSLSTASKPKTKAKAKKK